VLAAAERCEDSARDFDEVASAFDSESARQTAAKLRIEAQRLRELARAKEESDD
jgi:hypothetical protein